MPTIKTQAAQRVLIAVAQTCVDQAEKAKNEREAIQTTMESVRSSLSPTPQALTSVLDSRFKVERLQGREDAYLSVAKGIRAGLKEVLAEVQSEDNVE